MSKSYKKFSVIKQEKVDKKFWNKDVRNYKSSEALKGSQYKKIQSNWSNWKYRWTLEQAIEGYTPSVLFPTLESYIEYWKRCCYRK